MPQDSATGSGPSALAIGDLNGDGQRDLALANGGSNIVSVLLATPTSYAQISRSLEADNFG
jgi:hypothetical protein